MEPSTAFGWLKEILGAAKMPAWLFAGATTCAVVAFLPEQWRSAVFLDGMNREARMWASVGSILFSVCWLGVIVPPWRKRRRTVHREKRNQRDRQIKLMAMPQDEWEVVLTFIMSGRSQRELPIEHPAVVSLVRQGILLRASDFEFVGSATYTLATWARSEILSGAVAPPPLEEERPGAGGRR